MVVNRMRICGSKKVERYISGSITRKQLSKGRRYIIKYYQEINFADIDHSVVILKGGCYINQNLGGVEP